MDGGINLYAYVGGDPINWIDPLGLAWYNDWHYNRNQYNRPQPSVEDALNHRWIELPADKKIYHCMGEGNKNNRKFVSPDGLNESVFHPHGYGRYSPVTAGNDPANMQTYNFYSPMWRHGVEPLFHIGFDVVPYWLWGNTPDDPTPWYRRVFGPNDDPCNPCNDEASIAP